MAETAAPTQAAARDPLASLAGQLRHAATGTQARLRRFHPLQHPQVAVFDTERLLQAAGLTAGGPQERQRWAVVLHCLALAQGAHDPRADAEPGAVLQRLRFSEARLRQLVEADGQLLATLLPRLARRLGSAGVGLNWHPLVTLWLHADSTDPERAALADAARQRIVRHYLLAQGRTTADPADTD